MLGEMKDRPDVQAYGSELHDALTHRRMVVPLSLRAPDLTIDDAYAISLAFLAHRIASGETVIGKKIGVTSAAVQEMLGVYQPDFGFLTDAMQVPDGGAVSIASSMIQPRAEAEIAFFLKRELRGPGVSAQDVLDATDYVSACFEIVDSRIDDWNIKIIDTIADNASCGVFVVGEQRIDPNAHDLSTLEARVFKNGSLISRGLGSAVQGSPATAVAWLANSLGAYDMPLSEGDIVLSGSLVPLEPARPGDRFEMDLAGLGSAAIRFC